MVNNYLKICGKIISVRSYKGRTYFTVFTKNAYKEDYFTVIAEGDLKPIVSNKETLSISGYITGNKPGVSTSLIHQLHATEIKPVESQLENVCGFKGCIPEEMRAKVLLNGTIKDIEDFKDKKGVTYRHYTIWIPAEKGSPTTLKCSWTVFKGMPKFDVGDKVIFLCDLLSNKKEAKGKTKIFNNLKVVDAAMKSEE